MYHISCHSIAILLPKISKFGFQWGLSGILPTKSLRFTQIVRSRFPFSISSLRSSSMRPPPEADLEKDIFSTIPWCRTLLDDPDFEVEPTWSRLYQAKSGENRLLAHTLKTDDTIAGWCSLYRRPGVSNNHVKDEVRTLLALREGLNGYPRVCHGGITSTLLDEIMSILVAVYRDSQGQTPENVTADLRVKFVKAVPLPSVLLVKAKVRDVQRERKYFVDAEMVDDKGTVLTRGEGLFISVPREKL